MLLIVICISACVPLAGNDDDAALQTCVNELNLTIREMHMYADSGWVVGRSSVGEWHLYRLNTKDQILQKRSPGASMQTNDQIAYINADEAYVLTQQDQHHLLYHTNNAGQHWTELAEIEREDAESTILSLDAQEDDSVSWLLQTEVASATAFNRVEFWYMKDGEVERRVHLDPSLAGMKTQLVFTTELVAWIGAEDIGSPYLYQSKDGGESWEKIELPYVGHSIIFRTEAIRWLDESNGIVMVQAESVTTEADSALILYQTNDGGQTWTETSRIQLSRDFLPVMSDFSSSTSGWISVDRRELLRSKNSLHEWVSVMNVTDLFEDAEGSIVTFGFSDDQQGWMVLHADERVRFLRTMDGGQNWNLACVSILDSLLDIESMHWSLDVTFREDVFRTLVLPRRRTWRR